MASLIWIAAAELALSPEGLAKTSLIQGER